MPCLIGVPEADDLLPDVGSEETVLTVADATDLTLRFLFDDAGGVKATGSSGAASRATLELIKVADEVRRALWPSRRLEIKARLADEKGRFDKQELLAHIVNHLLGRPLLFSTDARDVGRAAENALAKEKKDTADAKQAGDEAIRSARAAAAKDPSLLPKVAAAQTVRAAALVAVLKQPYNLKLPSSTVGAKRKQPEPEDIVRCAEAAVRKAAEQVRLQKDAFESLVEPKPPQEQPATDSSDDDACAADDRAAYHQEMAAIAAARSALCAAQCKHSEARIRLLEAQYELESAAEERERRERERRDAELNAKIAEVNESFRARRAEMRRYFELHRAYRHSRRQFQWEGDRLMLPMDKYVVLVSVADGPGGRVDFESGWPMVAATGDGLAALKFEEPMWPELPPSWRADAGDAPHWVERCRKLTVFTLIRTHWTPSLTRNRASDPG